MSYRIPPPLTKKPYFKAWKKEWAIQNIKEVKNYYIKITEKMQQIINYKKDNNFQK